MVTHIVSKEQLFLSTTQQNIALFICRRILLLKIRKSTLTNGYDINYIHCIYSNIRKNLSLHLLIFQNY